MRVVAVEELVASFAHAWNKDYFSTDNIETRQ